MSLLHRLFIPWELTFKIIKVLEVVRFAWTTMITMLTL